MQEKAAEEKLYGLSDPQNEEAFHHLTSSPRGALCALVWVCGCVFLGVPSTVGSGAPGLLIGLSLFADLEFTAANSMKCKYSFIESVKGRSAICVNEKAHI